MTKLMTYVPFSFMRAVFTSGQGLLIFAVLFCVCLDFGFAPFMPTIYEKFSLCNANKVRVWFTFLYDLKQSKMSI